MLFSLHLRIPIGPFTSGIRT